MQSLASEQQSDKWLIFWMSPDEKRLKPVVLSSNVSGFESLAADSSCQQLSAPLRVAVSACCVRLIHHLDESVSGR